MNEEYERGRKEGHAWAEVRRNDPGIDLRWVLVGEKGDFIRGFSKGLEEAESPEWQAECEEFGCHE